MKDQLQVYIMDVSAVRFVSNNLQSIVIKQCLCLQVSVNNVVMTDTGVGDDFRSTINQFLVLRFS